MVQETGEDRGEQIIFIEQILEKLEEIGQTDSHKGGIGQDASKTQGTLPGAHEASPKEAANEPATMAGRDKEGAQSLSMARVEGRGGTSRLGVSLETHVKIWYQKLKLKLSYK